MGTWEYRESIVPFVCAFAAQICAMPTDSSPRKDRAVKMVESGELSAKAAVEAVGLGPEEAGGGQSSLQVRSTPRFLSTPSLVKLVCGLWLWAAGEAAQVFGGSSRLGSAGSSCFL